MDYPKDYYYSIEAGGEFVEGHILMTSRQSRYMEKAIRKRMLEMGYSKPTLVIETGGDYDYIYDEDDDDFEAYAKEIIDIGGFATQVWSTLKEEK